MRNSEIKRKMSSLYTTTPIITPNIAEIHKLELENEIEKVKIMLSNEYVSVPGTNSEESGSLAEKEIKMKTILKTNLNKLRSKNKAKEKKITEFIDLINFYSSISPKNISTSSFLNSNFHLDDEVDQLKEQILEEEDKIVEEELNTEVLMETKSKIIQSSLVWKERLLTLTSVHKEVERKYKEVIDSKKQATISLYTVQNDVQRLQKFKEKNQKKFHSAFMKGRMFIEKSESEVKEKIEKISRDNLKSRVIFIQETISQRREILTKLQNRLSSNAMKSNEIKLSKEEINNIHKKLDLIKSYIPDCPQFFKPLTAENVQFIINSYSKLKFQEVSLSIKFQNLTEEQLEKQHKCDLIQKELNHLKESNQDLIRSPKYQSLTYNQLRTAMETDSVSINTQNFEGNQKILLKLYLEILNLGTVVCRAINIINQSSIFHQIDSSYMYSSTIINNAQHSFITKQAKEKTELKKKITFKDKKTFKTEVDNFEELMTFSISLYEIDEILSNVLKNCTNQHEISSMIKSDNITCFFSDIPDIKSRLQSPTTVPKLLILEINSIGNVIFKEKFTQVCTAVQEILLKISQQFEINKKEIYEFYNRTNPSMIELLEKAVSLELKPKVTLKYSLDIAEKFPQPKSVKKKIEEDLEYANQYKIIDSIKNISEEKPVKLRQEAPIRPENYSKSSPNEIMAELNFIKHKVSELKSLERKANSSSHRTLMSNNIRKPWFRPSSMSSSQSSNRPLTVNFKAKTREKNGL